MYSTVEKTSGQVEAFIRRLEKHRWFGALIQRLKKIRTGRCPYSEYHFRIPREPKGWYRLATIIHFLIGLSDWIASMQVPYIPKPEQTMFQLYSPKSVVSRPFSPDMPACPTPLCIYTWLLDVPGRLSQLDCDLFFSGVI
jgi:hypothetical protein